MCTRYAIDWMMNAVAFQCQLATPPLNLLLLLPLLLVGNPAPPAAPTAPAPPPPVAVTVPSTHSTTLSRIPIVESIPPTMAHADVTKRSNGRLHRETEHLSFRYLIPLTCPRGT
eukprot:COSAG06_NODE_8922_length_2032_cov_1.060010_2_plen_114_part_00